MANEYLKRTPSSAGNRSVYTWAGWLKRNKINQDYYLFSSGDDANNIFYVSVRRDANNNNLTVLFRDGDTSSHTLVFNNNSFRDPASWMHLVVAVDTTIVDSKSDRVKVYINGKKLTGWTTDQLANLNQNSLTATNAQGELHTIGDYSVSSGSYSDMQIFDYFLIDGQALTPDVFGFYKDGDGYMSSGTANATDFKPGQWMPHAPSKIKKDINRRGGFGVNGFYLPMNDSSNPGADFHCTPNSIIKLKGEDLPQPRNGAPTTSDAYVSELRSDPYAANLVLAVPGIALENTNTELVTNGTFTSNITGWTGYNSTPTWDSLYQRLAIDASTEFDGAETSSGVSVSASTNYTLEVDVDLGTAGGVRLQVRNSANSASLAFLDVSGSGTYAVNFASGSNTSVYIRLITSAGNTGTAYFDNVSLKLANAVRDYSADIKGSGTNKTLTAVGGAGVGYELGNYYGSAMTFDGSGDYFDTPESNNEYDLDGDYTIEFWVNFNSIGSFNDLVGTANNAVYLGSGKGGWVIGHATISNVGFRIGYQSNSTWVFEYHTGISAVANQWYHIAISRSGSTQQFIINGVVVRTDTQTNTITSTENTLRIGGGFGSTSGLLDGQIQDLRVYKGVAKYKGGFDVPKPYTPVGIEAFRTVADTCKNNFATLNPLIGAGTASGDTVPALKDGNLFLDNANQTQTQSSIGMSSGKWYCEYKLIGASVAATAYIGIVGDGPASKNNQNTYASVGFSHIRPGTGSNSYTKNWTATSLTTMSPALGYANGDIFGFALDLDSSPKNIKYYRNGTLIHTDSTIGDSGHYYFLAMRTNDGVSGANWSDVCANFGQNPSFSGTTTAGTNADDSGKGLFKYAVPSGFLALCEDNLPTPAIADPGKHFKTVLWSGDGNSGRSITGVGFQPDLVWVKSRTSTVQHYLVDSIRGPGKALRSDEAYAETSSDNWLRSFDSNGFSIGASSGWNGSGNNYVAWCWKAGGPAVSNSDGSITTQVSANPTAGFSIVKGTQTNGTTTFGHGLGKAPKMVITKQTNGTTGWYTYHKDIGSGNTLRLDNNSASTSFSHWVTDPTTSVFSMGSGFGVGEIYVAYCWAEIEGYSKIGSYVGNGSSDGSFVYCGFKPAWVLIKKTNGSGNENWRLFDSSRCSTNQNNKHLLPSSNSAESTETGMDFLSNGFKLRDNDAHQNQNGTTYIFAAFAESPFQTANAK